MSLTRKHFQAVADILRDEREAAASTSATCECHPEHTAVRLLTLDRVEDRLIAYFRTENPQFDSARFRRAAR